jgi:two-component system cell cycle sensor histidine kinase/response regulator CckA
VTAQGVSVRGLRGRLNRSSLGVKLIVFSAIATLLVITATFVALRARVEANVRTVFSRELGHGQQSFRQVQDQNLRVLLATSAIVSTSSGVRSALETIRIERTQGAEPSPAALETVQRELGVVFGDLDKDLLLVTDADGAVIASVGRVSVPQGNLLALPAVRHSLEAMEVHPDSSFGVLSVGAADARIPLQIGSVAIIVAGFPIGALVVGERIDEMVALPNTHAVVTVGDDVLTSTLASAPVGTTWPAHTSRDRIRLGGEEFVAAALPLGLAEDGRPATLHLVRSLSAALDPVTAALGRDFLLFGLLAVMLAAIAAAVASRSSLKPLARFVGFMRTGADAGTYARYEQEGEPAEIATLTDAYNDLIDSLGRQHVQLERHTAELSLTNAQLRAEILERERAERALHESEEQLRQSQKLESLGTLAGGIAHDFNNLLSVILGYAQFTLEDLKKDDPLHENIVSIQEAGERATGLVRQLLAFSRKQVLQPQILDLNDVVRGMRRMLQRLIGEDIDLRIELNDPIGSVFADRGQIEQVLLNLVVNARDAMPTGGTVLVETKAVVIDARMAREPDGIAAGPAVLLTVSDTGIGMDEATQRRIFEPFFTTKPPGKGTGLGLSTVYGIVHQSGGTVRVDSAPGQGCTFLIYFPVSVAREADDVATTPAEESLRGDETVLVAEDDAPMRGMVRRCLLELGYHVLDAPDGKRALEVSAMHNGPIHLLLSDVIMPRLSGRELAEQLRALRPELKVLFMSGHTEEAIERHGLLDQDMPFVHKPLTPEALARAVRDTIDRTTTGTSV